MGVTGAIVGLLLGAGAGIAGWLWGCRLLGGQSRALSGYRPWAMIAGALACGLLAVRYGLGAETLQLWALCLVLVTLSVTDLAALVIPNECVFAAVAMRVAYLVVVWACGQGDAMRLAIRSAVGAAAALVPMLVLALVMDRVLEQESMGGGDLKLLGVCGLYVGCWQLPFLLLVACLGGLATSAVRSHGTNGGLQPFPFGPSIAVALLVTLLVGPQVEGVLLLW